MPPEIFEVSCLLPVDVQTAFDWHKREDAFALMTPSWPPVKLLLRKGGITNGARTVIRVGLPPLAYVWSLEHCQYIEGEQFCDRQISGPFRSWFHRHLFAAEGAAACRLIDRIEFKLPAPASALPGAALLFRAQLSQMFAYRHKVLKQQF